MGCATIQKVTDDADEMDQIENIQFNDQLNDKLKKKKRKGPEQMSYSQVQRPNKIFSSTAPIDTVETLAERDQMWKSAIHISNAEDDQDSVLFLGEDTPKRELIVV